MNRVSGVDSTNIWKAYPGALSDTPADYINQCANVPSLKQATYTMETLHYKQDTWNQTWYHLYLKATLFHNYTINSKYNLLPICNI